MLLFQKRKWKEKKKQSIQQNITNNTHCYHTIEVRIVHLWIYALDRVFVYRIKQTNASNKIVSHFECVI